MLRSFLVVLLPAAALVAQTEREIRLPLEDGRLSVLELTRRVLDEYGYGGDAVQFEDVRIDVRGLRGAILVGALDRALGDVVDLKKADRGRTLVVTVDRVALQAARRDAKQRVLRAFGALAGRDLLERSYELRVPDGLGDDEPLVLCVHGLDSSAAVFDELRESLQPVSTGVFEYANDESVERIARELSQRLRAHAEQFPDRRIAIVAHSMGGLAARRVVEDPELDPGNVVGLAMLGTPNQGSQLAHLRFANDLAELVRGPGADPRLLRPWLDGFGEAGWDLDVDSPFLVDLNARPRNPAVTYTVVLGNRGLLTADELAERRDDLLARLELLESGAVLAPKLDAFLSDLDEVVAGKGDGVVSLARGRLDGAEIVEVDARHQELPHAAPVLEHVRAWVAELPGF